jgi:hypothetical protein
MIIELPHVNLRYFNKGCHATCLVILHDTLHSTK